MLTKEQQVNKVKQKLLTIAVGRTEVTSLHVNEVRAIFATLNLSYNLVTWCSSLATYYKLENK